MTIATVEACIIIVLQPECMQTIEERWKDVIEGQDFLKIVFRDKQSAPRRLLTDNTAPDPE